MKIEFRIPVFAAIDDKLAKVEDKVFIIQFLSGTKPTRLRICVNGKLSNQTISILDWNGSKKDKFLKAISYVLYSEKRLNEPKHFLTESQVKQIYSKGLVRSIQRNILTAETEQKRDILQNYNLIFIKS